MTILKDQDNPYAAPKLRGAKAPVARSKRERFFAVFASVFCVIMWITYQTAGTKVGFIFKDLGIYVHPFLQFQLSIYGSLIAAVWAVVPWIPARSRLTPTLLTNIAVIGYICWSTIAAVLAVAQLSNLIEEVGKGT